MELGRDALVDVYRRMRTIRAFEEKLTELVAGGKIGGFLHLYAGEEAVAVGVCAHLGTRDWVASTHRGHGHCIAKGGDVRRMFAELLGKATGYCRGKGGSMHIADPELGIIGANGIVGGGLPIATGCALASRLRGDGRVTLCFFGDGASNQGSFHESLNLAGLWRLPVVYVCENNLYAVSTRQDRAQAIADIASRAASYGMEGVVVDGQDVGAVYEAVGAAARNARAGAGPALLEAKTYRWYGHCEADPPTTVYRTKEEEAQWRRRDPIALLRARLLAEAAATEAELARWEAEEEQLIEDAVKFALDSGEAPVESAREGVFADA
jgi:pyruvate dehydrogenase E1 component alpha subunit